MPFSQAIWFFSFNALSKNKDYTELKVALVLTYVTDTVSGIM